MSLRSLLANRYVRGVGAGLVGRGVVVVGGALGTWSMTRLLGRGEYANAVFAIQMAAILGSVTPFGMDALALFLGAKNRTPEASRALIATTSRRVLVTSVSTAALLAVAVVLARPLLAPLQHWWFLAALLLVPLFATNALSEQFALGQDRVTESLLVGRVGDALRGALLVLGFLLIPTGGGVWVAATYVAAGAVPVLLWVVLLRPWGASMALTREDRVYARRFVGAQIAQQGLERIDIVMLGMMVASGEVGDYAIGAQFALLVVLGHQLLTPALVPRFAELVAAQDLDAAGREYTVIQTASLVASLVFAIVLLLGQPLFDLAFPAHTMAYPVLITLAAARTAKVGFGITGRAMALLGMSGWSLWINIALLTLVVVLNLALIPWFGALGAALGTLISFFSLNAVGYTVVARVGGVRTLSLFLPFCVVAACGFLVARAFDILANPAAIGGLLACLAVVVIVNRAALRVVIEASLERLRKRFRT